MLVLGIDPSLTSTGVCISRYNLAYYTEVIRSDKDQDTYTRINYIVDKIFDIAVRYEPEKIVIEGVAFGGVGNATRDLAGLHYMLACSLKLVYDDVIIVPPTSLKKFATGSGKAKKQDMYNSLPEHIKEHFSEIGLQKTKGLPDIVDAYWLTQIDK